MAFKIRSNVTLPTTHNCPHVGLTSAAVAAQILGHVRGGPGLEVATDDTTRSVRIGLRIGPRTRPTLDVDPDGELEYKGPTLDGQNHFKEENTFTTIEAVELNILSDRRCKTDIHELEGLVDPDEAVGILHNLRAYRYRLMDGVGKDTESLLQLGVMADEFQTVMTSILGEPPLPQETTKPHQSVNYNHVLMLLLLNVQLLERRVAELETIVTGR